MNSKHRLSISIVIVTILASSGSLFIGGCAFDKDGGGPGSVMARIGGHGNAVIEPKRCLLKIAIVSRPFGDALMNGAVWRVADEQVIPATERRAWEVNGLRVGRISGDLPLELETALAETAPQKKVTPTNFFVDNGEPSLVIVSPAFDEVSLLLNRENRIFGRDFKDATGFFRVTPQQEGTNEVSLRLVPELHHGPIQRRFQALPTPSPIGPQEFIINSGQQEETIRDLAITLTLAPSQVAVIGCRPEFKRSLGSVMLTEAVAHSDQRLEKLVLIWASRNFQHDSKNNDILHTNDRSKLFKRLKEPSSSSMNPAPTPEIPPIQSDEPPTTANPVTVPKLTTVTKSDVVNPNASPAQSTRKSKTVSSQIPPNNNSGSPP